MKVRARRMDLTSIILTFAALIVYAALLLASTVAHAETTTATITTAPLAAGIGVSTIAQPLMTLLQPYIEDAGGLAFLALNAWLARHVRNTMLRSAIEAAVQRGAQGVYGALVTQGKSVMDKSTVNALTASHVNDILATLPAALKALGVTPDGVHAMVTKNLGGLLATDPTVTVSAPQALQQVMMPAKVGA